MTKVSVIIPVYGVEKYIERCARSLFEQSLKDMEFIFVDDCTKDKSIEILSGIINQYPKIKDCVTIIRHKTNMGLPAARQTGINIATGEYIAHCDSDDWVDSQMYEKMYNCAKDNDADIVRCSFVRDYINRQDICIQLEDDIYSDKIKFMASLLMGKDLSSMCDKLVRRDIAKGFPILYPKYSMQEDHVVTIQYAYYSTNIQNIKEPLYHYCYNATSITHQSSVENYKNRFHQVVANSNIIFGFLKDKGLDNVLRNEILCQKFHCREHLEGVLDDKECLKLWRETYPELTLIRFLLCNCGLKLKLKYILIAMGVFPCVKKVFNSLH